MAIAEAKVGDQWDTASGGIATITLIGATPRGRSLFGVVNYRGGTHAAQWDADGLSATDGDRLIQPHRRPRSRPLRRAELDNLIGQTLIDRNNRQRRTLVTEVIGTLGIVVLGTYPQITATAEDLYYDWLFADGSAVSVPLSEGATD